MARTAPSRLQVLANFCAAAAESMGYTLMRTAHSTFVKETEDFSCQILSREGLTVASPTTMGATWYTGLDYSRVIGRFDYREGDICVVSDPYSGFVATHAPDLHMWRPVFHQGELICFVGNHIHNTDVGGAVPASLSRTLTEVHQEGLRIPPMRLMRDGQMNEDLLAMIETNVRLPDQNHGDLLAQIACTEVGARKMQDVIARFGPADFTEGLAGLLDYAEAQARAIIRDLPDGEYCFADYADEDQTGGYPVRICVTLRVRGDELEVDYTGSDPQLVSSLNMPTGGYPRHSLAMVGVVYALYCLDPTVMLNYGLVRPVRAVLPEGSVVNPVKPAAVGMRSLLSNLAQTAVIGAFARIVPDRMPASPGNGLSILNVRTSTRDGRPVMASIGPVGGGAGGGPRADGAEGCGANMSFLKNTPVEINEAEVPIDILRYGLVPDSGGPGRWRGGSGLEMEFRVSAPQTMVTARNRDRSRFGAWGLAGGKAGLQSTFTRNPDSETPEELGSIDLVPCAPGDVIRLRGPGAGGYGDPLERPVDEVMTDIRRGFITPDHAQTHYGLVLTPGGLPDPAATKTARARIAAERPPESGFCSNRQEFEAVWTPARYAALTAILAALPVNWRYFIKHAIFAEIGTTPAPDPAETHRVTAAFAKLRARYPELPEVAL
ncbi:hydantoinase B/oxoprolinase family protein [Szabonella alba]|uniref:Hydantoinase B/oxoprolinase family protein n=1 Tax=Szabonella alba TaxID=2804194 RepID=A0A8K0VCI0_9RHOB|nr:hydantoinase B/oxoprolinase family protein [Szabonella alba]MBL4916767.1 hydantoinase B/oxoprolinase family protein [Szabonella alba]